MRVSKECLVKALNEGFKIWLRVDNRTVGNIAEWFKDDVRVLLTVGEFSVSQKVKKSMKCSKVVVNKEIKRMELVG